MTDRPHYGIIKIVKGSTSNNVPDGHEKKFENLKKPLTNRRESGIIKIVKGSTSNNVPDGHEKKFEKVLKTP